MLGDGEWSSGIPSTRPAFGRGFGGTGDAGVWSRGVFWSSRRKQHAGRRENQGDSPPLNVYPGWGDASVSEETCSQIATS